jgi:outer membrane lipoprotein-sorting protein
MKKLGLTLALALVAASAGAQTAEEVVARYLEARGGLERLRQVQSLRLTGRMVLPGLVAPFVLELKRPAKMRTDFAIEDRQAVRAYDGKQAWMLLPLPGESPRPMSPDEAADAKAQADVDLSPLVDSEAKGFTVELVGRERRGGSDAWKLVVRGGGGSPRTLFLDSGTHLVVQTEEERTVEGETVLFVTEVGEYRTVDGIVFPHQIHLGPVGSAERQRLVFEKIEVNPTLDDRRFSMPTGGARR